MLELEQIRGHIAVAITTHVLHDELLVVLGVGARGTRAHPTEQEQRGAAVIERQRSILRFASRIRRCECGFPHLYRQLRNTASDKRRWRGRDTEGLDDRIEVGAAIELFDGLLCGQLSGAPPLRLKSLTSPSCRPNCVASVARSLLSPFSSFCCNCSSRSPKISEA